MSANLRIVALRGLGEVGKKMIGIEHVRNVLLDLSRFLYRETRRRPMVSVATIAG